MRCLSQPLRQIRSFPGHQQLSFGQRASGFEFFNSGFFGIFKKGVESRFRHFHCHHHIYVQPYQSPVKLKPIDFNLYFDQQCSFINCATLWKLGRQGDSSPPRAGLTAAVGALCSVGAGRSSQPVQSARDGHK